MSVKQYYLQIEDYDWVDVADHFRGIESFFHRNRRKVMLGLIHKFSSRSLLLDAGCGSGLILQYLPPGAIGVDINPRCIALARKYAPGSMLIQSDLENLPIRDDVLTTIICAETLEHLPSPEKAIDHFHRTLKPQGILIGSVPHRSILWKFRVLSSTCPHSEPFHNEYELEEIKIMFKTFDFVLFKYSLLRLNIVFVVVVK